MYVKINVCTVCENKRKILLNYNIFINNVDTCFINNTNILCLFLILYYIAQFKRLCKLFFYN